MKKNITIRLSEKSVENAIAFFDKLKKALKIEREFLYESALWIQERANELLEERTGLFKGTMNLAQKWEIEFVNDTTIKLYNRDENSAYVEFGTGRTGSMFPHEKSRSLDYEYDVNGHGEDGWNFVCEDSNGKKYYFRGFTGYEGKSFLYDAYWEYYYENIYKKIFEKVINKKLKDLK